jgi:guanidinobutyrase
MPRFGGIASMFRLPLEAAADGLDAAFVGVPMDHGTSNRAGTRHGPRQIRAESVLVRPYNMATRAAPFDSLQVADLGDIAVNPYSLEKSVPLIERGLTAIHRARCIPLVLGGDHTLAYPALRAAAAAHGPVGLVHVDAHADINDTMFGEPIAHGTPFRRALEAGAIDPRRTVQIGLRGTGYAADDFDWSRGKGFRVVAAEQCWHRSLAPLMEEVRVQMGTGPVYLSFDIDSLDPAFAPGTGTPEIGGLTTVQALEIIRGCRGLRLVGADLVEVSPPYDPSGNTALTAANLLFEMLCVLPGVAARA